MAGDIKISRRNLEALKGRRLRVINPASKHVGRIGTFRGFRGDQSKGNPYVTIQFGLFIDTISARSLELLPE